MQPEQFGGLVDAVAVEVDQRHGAGLLGGQEPIGEHPVELGRSTTGRSTARPARAEALPGPAVHPSTTAIRHAVLPGNRHPDAPPGPATAPSGVL
ncbi:hypothetical protein AB0D10_03470 [Kitasatospora sp. NPDC048545]|uniref:hypothetical protein n=1 Tax=Kitasatospora sp. NPDC048545 TaxID=3157208 RepID=UPI0033CF37C2